MAASKRYKNDRQYLSGCDFTVFVFFDQSQVLRLKSCAHGNHHAPAFFELLNQWWWDMADGCSYDNAVKGCVLRPSIIAIGNVCFDIVITKSG